MSLFTLSHHSLLLLCLLVLCAAHHAACAPEDLPQQPSEHLTPRQQEGSGDAGATTGDYYYTQPSWQEGDGSSTTVETGGDGARATTSADGARDTASSSAAAPAPTTSSDDGYDGWYTPTAARSSSSTSASPSYEAASSSYEASGTASPATDYYESKQEESAMSSSTDASAAAAASSSDGQQDTTTTEQYTPPASTDSISSSTTVGATATSTGTTTADPTSTRTYSVTSSAATPSLVLGSHECALDVRAVDGTCPSDSFCNAATRACVLLLSNGAQCYEDFQCGSTYCVDGTCGPQPLPHGSGKALSGGQIAGVTVGSVAGAVLAVGALMWWCIGRRQRRHNDRGANARSRARKFEQIRAQDEMDADMVEQGGGVRGSKYDMLTQLMQRASAGHGGQMAYGNLGADAAPAPAAEQQPSMQERAIPTHAMMAVPGRGMHHRESKVEATEAPPSGDRCAYEAQQYYGSLASDTEPSSPPAASDDPRHKSWMTTGSLIDPHVLERPPSTLVRDSSINNPHAPLFHVTAPPDPNTVAAGGEAHVPTIPPPRSAGSPSASAPAEQGPVPDRRSSWLLKEIAERWRQGSSSGARASGITLPHSDKDGGLSATADNPFRNSSSSSSSGGGGGGGSMTPEHNRTDSMISTLKMPPLVQDPDAWTAEDNTSLTSDPSPRPNHL